MRVCVCVRARVVVVVGRVSPSPRAPAPLRQGLARGGAGQGGAAHERVRTVAQAQQLVLDAVGDRLAGLLLRRVRLF